MRAKRRFEERKRKLRVLNRIYRDWGGGIRWDGKHLYRDWSRWYGIHNWTPDLIEWWEPESQRSMSERGHHKQWLNPMMKKPWRRRSHKVIHDLFVGRVDPDEVLFPVYGRPWIYYW